MVEIIIHSNFIKTDVTALKIIKNDYLMIGIGHVAHIYKICCRQIVFKTNVFIGQKIHGFVPNLQQSQVAIFGGKLCKIYNIYLESDERNLYSKILLRNLEKNLECSDWIITLIWIKDYTYIAILTAHNVVQFWDINSNNITNTFNCEEKCILYSGLLYEIKDHVLAMVGTAFSQIVLWSTGSERVYNRISGHKGVIFSISYHEEKNIIVSTSDDRSVRIWKLNGRNKQNLLSYWQQLEILPEATMFGHAARVMRNLVYQNFIISVGEDSIMCIWTLKGNLVNKRKVCHSGTLWCLDGDFDKNIIITAGSDSGVTLHKGFIDQAISEIETLEFQYEDLVPKKLVLTARGNVVCVTEKGYVLYYDFEIEEWSIKYKIPRENANFRLAASSCRQFMAITSGDGYIDVFAETCKFDPNLIQYISDKIIDGRILSVYWVANRCLVVCDAKGVISLWGPQGDSCIKIDSFNLPKCKQKWLTAAAMDPLSRQFLLVGDRCGNLHLFKKGLDDPIQSLLKVHGNIGLNTIEFFDNKVITTGRDGSVKYFMLKVMQNNCVLLQYMYHVKLSFDWVENFIDREKQIVCGFREANLVVWDLNEKSVVMDVQCGGGHRSWDLMKCWMEHENKKLKCLRFVFIKNSLVHSINAKYDDIASKSIIKGFHSKEINCCVNIPIELHGSEGFILISAGEDTSINISLCHMNSMNFNLEHINDLSYHSSSIRCFYLSRKINNGNHKSEYILYSAGGRAQICALWLEVSSIGNRLNIDCKEIGNYMLKGTDLERRKKNGSWRNVQIDSDAETRFMSLHCLPKNIANLTSDDSNECFHNILLAGSSDGLLRVYRTAFDGKKCDFILSESLEFHKKCILKVFSFCIKGLYLVITLAVDGTVAFWDFTLYVNDRDLKESSTLQPFETMKIHQAGINAFDLEILDENTIILVTGGDDNMLSINVICFENEENSLKLEKIDDWSCEDYHCSQITGVKVFKDRKLIVSVSIDQRVTILRWSLDGDLEIGCDFIGQYYSSVSDIQGLDIVKCKGRSILLCLFGKGIEVITVEVPALPVSSGHMTTSNMSAKVEQVVKPVLLGEGPHWDADQQCLYYVSIFDHTIHKYVPATGKATKTKLSGNVGFIVPVSETTDQFVVGIDRKIIVVRWNGQDSSSAEVVKEIAEVDKEEGYNTNRFNDGKADPKGRLYAGTMGKEDPPGKFQVNKGSLFVFNKNGAEKKAENVSISNGLCWDTNKNIMYYIDSLEYAIRAYDYDSKTGAMKNQRMVFDYKKNNISGLPDGMTIDTDGNLWIACFDGSQVIKVDPVKGSLLQSVAIPALQVTSVAFGGKNLDELYVTSASMNIKSEQKPPCGALFKVTGLNAKGYKGVSCVL